MNSYEIIKRIEEHCRHEIKPRRLRQHVIFSLQREIDKHDALASKIEAVLAGADTYNPVTHKPIRRSK